MSAPDFLVRAVPRFGRPLFRLGRKAVENARRTLDTDVIDVFQLFWLGKMSAFTRGVQAEMAAQAMHLNLLDQPARFGFFSNLPRRHTT